MDFKVGDRVTWSVYGKVCTGTVKRIIGDEDSQLYVKDDLIVEVDDEMAWYKGQIVTVIPDRTVRKI